MRVRGEIGLVVLDDDELAVAAQAGARVDDLAGGAREHRLPGRARDVDALEVRGLGKTGRRSCPSRATPSRASRRRRRRSPAGARRGRVGLRRAARRCTAPPWRPSRAAAPRRARSVAQRLLRIRLLDRLGLRLVVVGVARDAARRGRRMRAAAARPASTRRPAARLRSGVVVTPDGDATAGFARRRQPQHLADANHVHVLDVVPRGELAVVEAVSSAIWYSVSPRLTVYVGPLRLGVRRRGAACRARPAQPAAAADGRECAVRSSTGARVRDAQPASASATSTTAARCERVRIEVSERADGRTSTNRQGHRAIVHASPESNGTNLTASSVVFLDAAGRRLEHRQPLHAALVAGLRERQHHAPAGLRDSASSAVGTCVAPAVTTIASTASSSLEVVAAVAVLERNVAQLERLQVAPRLGDQRADALDGVHLARDVREHRGLVAAAGADLEHVAELAAVARELGHARDDPRLRDRLPVADRQRRVLVGADRQRFVDEDVARHRVHRGQHDLVRMPCSRRRSTMRVRVRADVMPMPLRCAVADACAMRRQSCQPGRDARHQVAVREIDLQRRDRHVARARPRGSRCPRPRPPPRRRRRPSTRSRRADSARGSTSSALCRRPRRVTACRAAARAECRAR